MATQRNVFNLKEKLMSDAETTPRVTIAEMSIDTQMVVDMLRSTPVGETVTYGARADKTGRALPDGARDPKSRSWACAQTE